jgi:hypothetical protein
MYAKAIVILTVGIIGAVLSSGCGSDRRAPVPSSISGTAAKGAAIATATIAIKDKYGATRDAITDPEGKFTVDVTGLAGPFLIRATHGSTAFYSLATSPGTANIHPLTNLITRNWFKFNGREVETVFDAPGPLVPVPQAAQIRTAESILRELLGDMLLSAGIDPAGFDLISTPFNADGNGFDNILDRLKVELWLDDAVVNEVDPETKIPAATILSMPIAIDLITIGNPVDAAKAAVNQELAGLLAALNTRNCLLTQADIAPFFEPDYRHDGLGLPSMTEDLRRFVCREGQQTDLTEFAVTDVLSYDDFPNPRRADLKKFLRGKIRVTTQNGSTGMMLSFGLVGGKWVAVGNGRPVTIEARSSWSLHVRATETVSKHLEVNVADYLDRAKSVRISGPGIDGDRVVPKVCDDFTGDPRSCQASDYEEWVVHPARYFTLDACADPLLPFPYAGAVYEFEVTWENDTKTVWKQLISGRPGEAPGDLPEFKGIATFAFADVAGRTITARAWTPLWVGELPPPLLRLRGDDGVIGTETARWTRTPVPGVYNEFTVTIPTAHNGRTVTQAALGQDARYPASRGWGKTAVYHYFD